MSFYSLALFIHVTAALTLFVAVGLNFVSMLRLRAARQTEQVRDWARLGLQAGRINPAAVLFIAGSAIYMVTTVWGWQTAWVDVVLATFIGHGMVVSMIENPRLSKLYKGALKASAGPVSQELYVLAHDALLWTVELTVTSTTVGMIFLMSVKPNLMVSLIAVGITLVIGIALALPFWQTDHAQVHAARSGRIA